MQIDYRAAFIPVGLLALALAIPATAKDKEAPPKAFNDLQACRAITDEKARLACFDTASAAMAKDVEENNLVLLDRTAVRKTQRSLFGFSTPDLPFMDDEKEPEFTQIETTIKSAGQIGNGRWQFTTEEGSIWQTTEPLSNFLKPGMTVVIKKASLGSYFIKAGRGQSVRGKRVG